MDIHRFIIRLTMVMAFLFGGSGVAATAGNAPALEPDTGRPISHADTLDIKTPHSYTKLDAHDNDLPDSASSWVMVRDNTTGLIWEVKTDDESFHDRDNKYTWYDVNPLVNCGNAGTPGDGTDTTDFIDALNSSNFGGYSDWRLPSQEELATIIDHGRSNPAIDTGYFPNTQGSDYWSSTTGDYAEDAWLVSFHGGNMYNVYKSDSYYVRAVRGGR